MVLTTLTWSATNCKNKQINMEEQQVMRYCWCLLRLLLLTLVGCGIPLVVSRCFLLLFVVVELCGFLTPDLNASRVHTSAFKYELALAVKCCSSTSLPWSTIKEIQTLLHINLPAIKLYQTREIWIRMSITSITHLIAGQIDIFSVSFTMLDAWCW